MNIKFLLIAIATVSITSCSTAYKSGQTPDDVYYSPVRGIEEKKETVKQRREEPRQDYRIDDYEEREIRMATRDRRWRDLNNTYDYNCYYDPYRYGYNYGYYYNPYYYNRPVYLPGYTIVNPKNNTPRMTNLGSYNNSTITVANSKAGQTRWVQSTRTYNNSNTNSGGSYGRRIITPSTAPAGNSGSTRRVEYGNDNNNSRTYNPTNNNNNSSRTVTPSSSSSGSGSSSSGGSVTRPTRGN